MNIDITAIIVAVIASGCSLVGSFAAISKGNKEKEIKDALREQRYNYRLDDFNKKIVRLEKKVDEHNGYGKKFGEVATSMAVMAKDIEYLKNRP